LIRKWPRLRGWLDQDRVGLIAQRQIRQDAERWQRHDREPGRLYSAEALAEALKWRTTWETRWGALEREFVEAGEKQQREETERDAARKRREDEAERQKLLAAQALARRTRIAAVVLGVLLLITAVVGSLAIDQWLSAQWHTKEEYQYAMSAKEQAWKAEAKAIEAHDGLLLSVAQTLKDPFQHTALTEASIFISR
jgi:hypothetical protein